MRQFKIHNSKLKTAWKGPAPDPRHPILGTRHPALLPRTTFTAFFVTLLALSAACGSSQAPDANQTAGIIVVNAPAAGEVRRILVGEGVEVSAGAPIIDIAVETPSQNKPANAGESAESQAVRGVKSSQAEIEAARAEVIKHDAEVQRLTPLVSSGEASSGQLDGERALYERAQQRLQKAKDSEQQAESGLRLARQPGAQSGVAQTTGPSEQIIQARATSAGTVAVINIRVGDHVKSGQPLATLRANGN